MLGVESKLIRMDKITKIDVYTLVSCKTWPSAPNYKIVIYIVFHHSLTGRHNLFLLCIQTTKFSTQMHSHKIQILYYSFNRYVFFFLLFRLFYCKYRNVHFLNYYFENIIWENTIVTILTCKWQIVISHK